jgi:hypothetical protein
VGDCHLGSVEEAMNNEIEDADDERPAAIIHDHSIRASGGSSISSIKNFISGNKDLLLGLLLGLAIVEGSALFYEWRHKAQQQELKRYELSDFITTHFNPLLAEVQTDHDLIQAYGLSKTVAQTCKR